jgi:hypothetical protein
VSSAGGQRVASSLQLSGRQNFAMAIYCRRSAGERSVVCAKSKG